MFELYLAGVDQNEIDESVGTLDIFLNDIPGVLINKPSYFSSNMLYHAHRTFNNIKSNMKIKQPYDTPSQLLCEIIKYLGGYGVIGTQCFNTNLYKAGLPELELHNLNNYYYESMYNQRHVNYAWRQFFVSVLDYRAEYVYDKTNALRIEELMDMIKRIFSFSDMSYICSLLACNIQSLLSEPSVSNVSDEL